MEQEEKEKFIRLRISLGEGKLQVAKDLIEKRHYNDAISKSYYAMFYAARALLLAKGEDPHSHKGVVTLFSKYFVKNGMIEKSYGKMLSVAKQAREDCDYEERIRSTYEEAKDALNNAREFVRKCKKVVEQLVGDQI